MLFKKGLLISLSALIILGIGATTNNINVNAKHRTVRSSRIMKRNSVTKYNHSINRLTKRIKFNKRHHKSNKILYKQIRSLKKQAKKARKNNKNRAFYRHYKLATWYATHAKKLSVKMDNTNNSFRLGHDDAVTNDNTLHMKYAHNSNYRKGWIISHVLNNTSYYDSNSRKASVRTFNKVIKLYRQGITFAHNHHKSTVYLGDDDLWNLTQD